MNKWLETSLGVSPAALIRGVRFGPRHFARAARRSFKTSAPFAPTAERGSLGLRERSLDELLGTRKAAITLSVTAYEDGMLPLRDALPVLSLAVAEQPTTVVEIGTFMGHTARALAQNLPAATIHTIDLPPDFDTATPTDCSRIPKDDFHLIAKRQVGREFRETPFASRIFQHFADTAEMDFRKLGSASFFFIDGSHTYEYARNDSEKCLTIADPGSTFLWHDCDDAHEGVVRFLREWEEQGRDVVMIAGTTLGYWKSPA